MHHPALTGRSWLTRPRVVGTPLAWARGSALFGGLLGALSPTAVLVGGLSVDLIRFGLTAPVLQEWPLVALSVLGIAALGGTLGTALGAGVGLLQPALLDRVRGRVPLPVLALGQGLVGGVAGAATALGTFAGLIAVVGIPPSNLAIAVLLLGSFGAVLGAVATLGWWLPFTVLLVTGGRTGRLTAAAATATSTAVYLLMLLLGLS